MHSRGKDKNLIMLKLKLQKSQRETSVAINYKFFFLKFNLFLLERNHLQKEEETERKVFCPLIHSAGGCSDQS